MQSNAAASGGGVGFLGLLTIAFIVLKLTGKVSWSWWWVLAPSWIPAALVFAALAAIFLLWFVAGRGVDPLRGRQR